MEGEKKADAVMQAWNNQNGRKDVTLNLISIKSMTTNSV